eukprot:UN18047
MACLALGTCYALYYDSEEFLTIFTSDTSYFRFFVRKVIGSTLDENMQNQKVIVWLLLSKAQAWARSAND